MRLKGSSLTVKQGSVCCSPGEWFSGESIIGSNLGGVEKVVVPDTFSKLSYILIVRRIFGLGPALGLRWVAATNNPSRLLFISVFSLKVSFVLTDAAVGQNAGPNFFSLWAKGDPELKSSSNSKEEVLDLEPRLRLDRSLFLKILPDFVRNGCLDNEFCFFRLYMH